MKTLKLFFCLFIYSQSYAQYTFPHIILPNHKEKWRTYLDAKSVPYIIKDFASDNKNNVLILGTVLGNPNNFHLVNPGAFQTTVATAGSGQNICLVKFDSSGKKLWGTYFGINLLPSAIDCDASGNIYICGRLNGTTPVQNLLPVTPNAHQTQQVPFIQIINNQPVAQYRGEGFVSKFSPTGSLLWSTYYGGEGYDGLEDIKIDKKNNVYCTGYTSSATGIGTPGSFKSIFLPDSYGDGTNGMLVKFDSLGHREWGTYFGGNYTTDTYCSYLSIDSSENIVIAGTTDSHTEISTPGTHLQYLATTGGNPSRIFLAKFDSRGSRLWGTYYGSSQNIPPSQNFILRGLTTVGDKIFFDGFTNITSEISSPGSFMEQNAGDYDPFIVRMNSDGTRNWGSYYGSQLKDGVNDRCLQVSPDKKSLYMLGGTKSPVGISTTNAYNPEEINGNAFLIKIDLMGNKIWGSYLSAYHNLQVPSNGNFSNGGMLLCTKEGALYTGIPQPTQGSLPIGDTTVFENIAGAGTNLFTKYSDTAFKPIIITAPAVPVVPLSFEVFPNPSNGQFTIRTTSAQPLDYIIYAADGKRIKTGTTSGYFTNVNITTAAAGSYTVRATERSTGIIYHRKIIKR